jgi:hypothetical protein
MYSDAITSERGNRRMAVFGGRVGLWVGGRGKWGQGDKARGDKARWGQGEVGTRGSRDKGTRRGGDKGKWGQGEGRQGEAKTEGNKQFVGIDTDLPYKNSIIKNRYP